MGEIILMGYLGAGALMDGKRKPISFAYLWVGIVLAIAFLWGEWSESKLTLIDLILRLLPGAFFLICSRLTQEKVGYGDGMMLLILGGCFPLSSLWLICLMAIFLLTLWAGLLLTLKKAGRHTKIPFLPFLWAASLIVWRCTNG